MDIIVLTIKILPKQNWGCKSRGMALITEKYYWFKKIFLFIISVRIKIVNNILIPFFNLFEFCKSYTPTFANPKRIYEEIYNYFLLTFCYFILDSSK